MSRLNYVYVSHIAYQFLQSFDIDVWLIPVPVLCQIWMLMEMIYLVLVSVAILINVFFLYTFYGVPPEDVQHLR